MLIVHASSSCDICLDAYDWDTPTQLPHAIPCGHIFCKTLVPLQLKGHNLCPFCRKPFVASRIVKLHVDRPATVSEEGIEDVELLQRLGAEEAKRQVELEAAVEQSKQRERALRESLERARQLRKQREGEAEARKQQEKNASGAVPSPRETRIRDEVVQIDSESSDTRTVWAAPPPSTRYGRGVGVWRSSSRRAANANLTSPFVSSAVPPSIQWGQGEGVGVWRARRNTDADLTSSLTISTHAPSRLQGWH
ncbi:uncharacterized protein LACBIDRAFT_325831 [Laccaria bicolor S238N-H82]|uniref:Predicted protein n=1 Tax=Laccaria bicolor (strain S238N-H82 / ATCC MYA-4686) TaxID=486041 RepID=B0D6D7_LACBS|nr:uncharacterized protein LACBIDRAFT_325831 [Laccaria bicolor S238N-H82]EDR09934.1 predicted protein [Laccaria bicolor S238N-H82]|eukprot:XP_001879319.1 predicted protein [Laccaria bicolor S238N-H82]